MNQDLKNLQQKYAINLFDWYNFKSKTTGKENDSKVLLIGDVDENFIFPFSKKVGQLSIVLETEEIAKATEYISAPKNVTIYNEFVSGNKDVIKRLLDDKTFDFVIVPTISEKVSTWIGSDLCKIVKYLAKTYTKNDGVVLLAFDNDSSYNVIAGSKVEEGVKNYSLADIERLKKETAEEYKNSKVKVYYPLPEFKFPLSIYSDNYLPVIDEESVIVRNLSKKGIFSEYCSSYILVFDANEKEKTEDDYETIYVKYNLNRTKCFALRTSIIENKNGKRQVVKKAVYTDANDHIKDMVEKVDVIKNKEIEILKPTGYEDEKTATDGKASVVFPFIEGKMLTDVIIERIKNGDNEKKVLTEYMFKLVGKFNGLIENYNLDCTFQNAILSDDKIYVIDSEWVAEDTTEVNFLRYRILKYFFKVAKQYLTYGTFKDLLRDFGINHMDAERYEDAENEFQSKVHENINNLDVAKYEEINPSFAKLYYIKAELERVKTQLDRITGENDIVDYHSNKQNETLRLTYVHVHNLEGIITTLRNEIGRLSAENVALYKREGVIYRLVRRVKEFMKKIFPSETRRNKICKYIYRTIRHPFKMLKTYFTRAGRNRIIGDFMIGDVYFECGKVELPKCDIPKVSIIIPCYNQIRYTYKCLYSIVKNTDPNETPYEVIIADDVSTDTTRNVSKYVNNVVVSRNKENLGFLKNCNEAAKLAKGEYIYFLNNDTEVHEGYLSSLVNLLDNDKTIGMAGSKLVFADGTLQEAGGIIWSDGQGANYGRGDNPDDFKYNYVREVDYISGAAIMIRKSLWNIIGGFDERYSPAYCEDSDLAFEVRKYGYKVVYQPLSRITHFEGVSCGTDTSDTNSIKSYQVVNNEKLKEKWENELQHHFSHTDVPNMFKARERAFDKKTILFIDHYVPTWDKDAGSKTVYSYMMMFKKKGYIVKFLGDNFLINSPYGEKLQQLGIEVLYGGDLQANIWDYLKDNRKNFDFVFLNRPHIAIKYIDFIRKNMIAKIIYYGHDLHYMRLQREYELIGDDSILYEFKYYRNLEYSLLYKSDMSYYPSYKEIEEIKKVDDNLKAKSINAYMFDEKEIEYRDFTTTKDLLFVGGFMHDPNKDALKWMNESIMPRIRARNTEINLTVVGSNATDEIKEICEKGGYNLLGYVTDEELDELYRKARIVIAPLRFGAGIKGKIIEAMAKGAAIITTNCGAEGIEDANRFMVVADDAQDFAQEVVKMYDDFELLSKLSIEAQKEINNKFTMEAAWNIVKDDF